MIEPKMFEYIKRTLTADIVKHAMESKGWSEDEAICNFMCSEVYRCLSIEKTKVWHYSVTALSGLYDDELDGHLVWPEAP